MAARILLIDTKDRRSRALEQALTDAGFEVVASVDERDDLYARMTELAPDAVIVDAELPSRDTLEHLAQLGRRFPRPIVMLADQDDPQVSLEAARAGVSAYVVDGLAPATVRSLVNVAIAHFQAHDALRSELGRVQQSLEQRKAVDRAKCLLMERQGIGEEAAYQRLRKMAMDRRLSLYELACELLG
ncbi:putative transcriptional regulatory protein pdtaR [wastewater metagenome]|uniref:Putative transcriptional regulatory protein pdtaR n=3 Tax=root TaxID=1 RepID=A0A5B8RHT9_9ZZZZ|nr:putative transcriptional regulatory protein pdtaR [uncultured organism]